MTPDTPTSDSATALREYAEGYLAEDEALMSARARGVDLGCPPVGPATGAVLQVLAAALRARAVVEIGTGAGVSGLYLLRGMLPDGVLTSIDVEPEHQSAARRAFADAGFGSGRTRLIMGRALDVLPRLTDEAYDLLFADAARHEYPSYHQQGVRLLRPGGVIVFDNVLGMREVARAVREDDRLVPMLLPLGEGMLVAAKTG